MQIAFCWQCFSMINYTFSIISFRSSIYFGLPSFVAMPIKLQCVFLLQSNKKTTLNQLNFNVDSEKQLTGVSEDQQCFWRKTNVRKKTPRSNLERKLKSVFFLSNRNCNRKIRVRKLVDWENCSLLQKEWCQNCPRD